MGVSVFPLEKVNIQGWNLLYFWFSYQFQLLLDLPACKKTSFLTPLGFPNTVQSYFHHAVMYFGQHFLSILEVLQFAINDKMICHKLFSKTDFQFSR